MRVSGAQVGDAVLEHCLGDVHSHDLPYQELRGGRLSPELFEPILEFRATQPDQLLGTADIRTNAG
jgi:hypothetical protein